MCPGIGADWSSGPGGDWVYRGSTPELQEFDDVGTAIYYGEYADLEERTAWIDRATDLQMFLSLRVFGVRTASGYPASRLVQGLSDDTAMGFRAVWDQREAFVPGEDTVKYASLWVWTETTVWNSIEGFDDVYSVDLGRATTDRGLIRHPFTQEVIEFRAIVESVETDPVDGIEVPANAVLWNAETDAWEAVGSGVTSVSKVVYDYSRFCQSTWHHGIPMTLADPAVMTAVEWDIGYDEVKSARESEASSSIRGTYDRVLGYVFELPCKKTIYHDFTHFDPMEIALFTGSKYADPYEASELLLAMDSLVFEEQTYAYAGSAATAFGVPWLSLVLPEHAGDVADKVQEFADAGFYPENMLTVNDGMVLATEAEWLARWQADLDWYDDKGILWISNGPFYLNAFDAAAQYAELLAFRDETYPFAPGDWDFGRVELPEVESVDVPTLQTGVAGDIGIGIQGPLPLLGQYLIFDAQTGELLLQGDLTSTADPNEFLIALSAMDMELLEAGTYDLALIAGSEQLARKAVFETRFRVIPAVGPGPGPGPGPGDIEPGGVDPGATYEGAEFAAKTFDTELGTMFADQTTLVLGLGIVGLIIGIAIALAIKRSE
jgi:peptide/nickel transport system substrate-binding protein